MRIYYSDIRFLDEAKARYPGTSSSKGSAFGVSLLAAAYKDYCKKTMPAIQILLTGKPIFPSAPEVHFSISHSKTHVLCAISDQPVGADTLDFRRVSPEVVKKLTTDEERELLSFYDIWALRESVYKLVGEGDLRTMRFYKKGDDIIPPVEGVRCRLYDEIPDSSTAISCFLGDFPDKFIEIPGKKLLRDESKLTRMMDERCMK